MARVSTLGSQALLSGGWQDDCLALVLPGGADLPYCRELNGRGTHAIRRYVEGGGAYLGLCAGAYFASGFVSFERTTPALAVEGPRELAFFPGSACSGLSGDFDYQSERGARATPLVDRDGRRFLDYCNGGCAFLFTRHLDRAYSAAEQASYPGVSVLARYATSCEETTAAAESKQMLEPCLSPGQAAAVVCAVGQGVAVLCGTHPELAPGSLDGESDADAVYAAHVARLRKDLTACDGARWGFWVQLLSAARLESWLEASVCARPYA
ncbi:hypothetical protein QBZ16_004364 [Prototheca wickerhamii]|uniref:Biotin-protein ligase N-terminal domain-containing protein n=1 Tax=Prototheca wickerhamii TaxID=3111 RepID=A0AAD9MGU1_PROWI|nr:hypothetical protein QBZ16_004364 [Prototheca wickerhamii]